MTPLLSTERLEEMLRQMAGSLPLVAHETPDYAEVTGPSLQAMSTNPDAILCLNDVPALISECLASRATAPVGVEINRLDAALCNFLNGVGDEPKGKWMVETRRNLDELASAYNACHEAGFMDIRQAAALSAKQENTNGR